MNHLKPSHKSIDDITPYVGGNTCRTNSDMFDNLASNENPFGCSPKVIKHLSSLTNLHHYPDGQSYLLLQALANHYNLPPKEILCGNGSEELLHLLARVYATANDHILIPQYGFSVYAIAAKSIGAIPVQIPRPSIAQIKIVQTSIIKPLISYELTAQDVLSHITTRTKIIFIDNPSNPIGDFMSRQELAKLVNDLPPDILLVIDAAYAEYLHNNQTYSAGHEFVSTHPNIVITRSFSKTYGLAGVRLGWMHAHSDVIETVNRVRPPFNVSAIAQQLGVVALQDQDFVQETLAQTTYWRDQLEATLVKKSIPYASPSSNFILVNFGDTCPQMLDTLKAQHILVRPMHAYDLPQWLRISIGAAQPMKRLIKIINM